MKRGAVVIQGSSARQWKLLVTSGHGESLGSANQSLPSHRMTLPGLEMVLKNYEFVP